MTAEKVGRSEVIMDCYRSRMIARVPRVAEMSAGFIKSHRESFRAAVGKKKCVDTTASALITHFFHYTCAPRRLRGGAGASERRCFPAPSANTSCGAKQHLIQLMLLRSSVRRCYSTTLLLGCGTAFGCGHKGTKTTQKDDEGNEVDDV